MKANMMKCEFRALSRPNGTCFWDSAICAEEDCKKAIKTMAKAMGNAYDPPRKRERAISEKHFR